MHALGEHIIVEFSGCSAEVLCSLPKIEQYMVEAAKQANAEVRETAFHKFSEAGVSGVVVIAESHLSIHTWPELLYASGDIYTCGNTTDPKKACEYLATMLQAKEVTMTVLKRGIQTPSGRFSHAVHSSVIEPLSLKIKEMPRKAKHRAS